VAPAEPVQVNSQLLGEVVTDRDVVGHSSPLDDAGVGYGGSGRGQDNVELVLGADVVAKGVAVKHFDLLGPFVLVCSRRRCPVPVDGACEAFVLGMLCSYRKTFFDAVFICGGDTDVGVSFAVGWTVGGYLVGAQNTLQLQGNAPSVDLITKSCHLALHSISCIAYIIFAGTFVLCLVYSGAICSTVVRKVHKPFHTTYITTCLHM
jgi:hypothetical protein